MSPQAPSDAVIQLGLRALSDGLRRKHSGAVGVVKSPTPTVLRRSDAQDEQTPTTRSPERLSR